MRRGISARFVSLTCLLVGVMLLGVPHFASAAEEDLRAEIEALRDRVAHLEARQTAAPAVGSAQESEPGWLSLSRGGLEAQLYGFLAAETFWESNATGGDRFLNIIPFNGGRNGGAEFGTSVNATRLGLRLRSTALEEPYGISARGVLEVDFDTGDGGPRIRHAYAELSHPQVDVLVGQTWAVVAQLSPDTVNSDNLFNLGNVYERVPQLRVSRELELGGGRFVVEGALLSFFGSFDQGDAGGVPLAIQQPPGFSYRIRPSSLPVGQARVAWWPWQDADAYAALSISAGQVRVEDETRSRQGVRHLLAAAELVLPSWGPFTLSTEIFWGRAPGFNGGVGQSVAIGSTGRARAVRSWGGFVQLGYQPTERWRCNLVYGIDDPEDRVEGLRMAIRRNQTALGNCFVALLPYLDLALEVQVVETKWWGLGSRFHAKDLRVTPALYLNF